MDIIKHKILLRTSIALAMFPMISFANMDVNLASDTVKILNVDETSMVSLLKI